MSAASVPVLVIASREADGTVLQAETEELLRALGSEPVHLDWNAALHASEVPGDFAAVIVCGRRNREPFIALLRRLRGWGDAVTLPLVVLLAHEDQPAVRDEAWRLGAVDVLHAPLDLAGLRAKLDFLLETRRRRTAVRQSLQDERALARVVSESERRHRLYETFLSNTPDLAYVFDLDHRFVYANDVLLKMWGRSWEESIGKTCLELGYEPWHAAMHDREIEQVKTTGAPIRGEVPFNGAFGRRIYDYIFIPIFGPGGEVEAVAGTTRDVTDRKNAEQEIVALLHKEERRAALLARVAEAGKKIASSLAIDAILQALTDETRAALGVHEALASLGDEPTAPPASGTLTVPLIGHGGRRLGVLQAVAKYEGEFGEEDESVLMHLAALAAVSIENARLYESLRDQERRKDEFLAMLAHELRNPLAPLRTGLELLRMRGLNERDAQVGEMMERQLVHLVRLVDDLMDVARLSRDKLLLKLAPLQLQQAIASAIDGARPAIEAAGHRLSIAVTNERLPVLGDLTRLAQSLGNLLHNAAKYTPDGGLITVSASRDGSEAVIEVRDDGIGIPAAMLPRLFQPFIQLENGRQRAQGGLGIGLSLVRKLVEMHGGRVTAASDGEGRGAAFTVRLPLLDAGGAQEEGQQTRMELQKVPEPKRVLLVDDNIDAAESLGMLLELIGHTVRLVHAGSEAVEAAREFAPDAVILDIGLPGMSGYEVAQALRADPALAGAVLVALTGWGSEDDRRHAHEAGFDYHLTKPVDADMIARILGSAGAAEPGSQQD